MTHAGLLPYLACLSPATIQTNVEGSQSLCRSSCVCQFLIINANESIKKESLLKSPFKSQYQPVKHCQHSALYRRFVQEINRDPFLLDSQRLVTQVVATQLRMLRCCDPVADSERLYARHDDPVDTWLIILHVSG